MKIYRLALVLLFVFGAHASAFAAKQAVSRWDNLVDVAYKFSWYPRKDLQDLLANKKGEYGQSLAEYCRLLTAELTTGSAKTELIDPDLFVSGKDWKKYYRLAVAQFILFLANDNETYLENAKSTLTVLSGKKEFSSIAFWHYLFQTYSDLVKNDRDAFVKNTFKLWQDVILRLEADDILMMGYKSSKTEFVKNLHFLYENIAHLIITQAIIEKTIPDLYPLGVIITSIKDKLSSENGYRNVVEAIVERMHGLKSDNSNLNFAVAFVEATANQYAFEDEKSAALLVSKYNLTRTYYELALSWANTPKGQAAILTQYMGFANYIIRRLTAKDDLLASNVFFRNLPAESNKLIKNANAVYDQLSLPAVQKRGFVHKGFNKKNNYITAMCQLWDSSAKLLMMQSAYYKSTSTSNPDAENLYVIESPLLQYLSFFRKYAGTDSEVVPDNAFFLAAYASKELGDLYRQSSKYSTNIKINDLAFSHQLEAVELFPMNIMGILQLAHQANQEGRANMYLQKTGPVASHFRRSKVASIWLDSHSTDYPNCVAIVKDVIPEIIDKAYFLVKFLQQSGGTDSEDGLYRKAVVMTRLLMALEVKHSEDVIENALSSIAKQDFKGRTMKEIFQASLPPNLVDLANSIPGIELRYRFTSLKNELYSSTDNAIHSYLRELYYEIPKT
ncbi:MAG: hypothetical protein JRF71_00325 [Deltaproteobacteria bacterium]|nr:hypothetical protein [Deltaproteobacteria bacterium]